MPTRGDILRGRLAVWPTFTFYISLQHPNVELFISTRELVSCQKLRRFYKNLQAICR